MFFIWPRHVLFNDYAFGILTAYDLITLRQA